MQITQSKKASDSSYLKISSQLLNLCTFQKWRKHLKSKCFEFQILVVVVTELKWQEAVTRELLKLVVNSF